MITAIEGIDVSAQTLMFADQELRDEMMLSDYNIQTHDVIYFREEHPTKRTKVRMRGRQDSQEGFFLAMCKSLTLDRMRRPFVSQLFLFTPHNC
jgi:hypothetical protein